MADFNKCIIITTGAKSDALELSGAGYNITNYSEIKCLSMLPACLALDRTVVACIGTGTPFIAFENGRGEHMGGTGVGGGAFTGLAERLLGVCDPKKIEEIAAYGKVSNINIMVGDIYKGNVIEELQIDYTASNFAKPVPSDISDIQYRKDVAIGIHSLVGEVVGIMAGQLAKYNGYESVVFCGTVCENKIISRILSNCLSIYGIKPIFIENPGFGTCFGAIMRYISDNLTHEKR
jgi:type II pantothenate kinase